MKSSEPNERDSESAWERAKRALLPATTLVAPSTAGQDLRGANASLTDRQNALAQSGSSQSPAANRAPPVRASTAESGSTTAGDHGRIPLTSSDTEAYGMPEFLQYNSQTGAMGDFEDWEGQR